MLAMQGNISMETVARFMPQFFAQFPEVAPGAHRYGFNVGFMTGMLEMGAFVGCLFLPYLADRISRKWALTVATGFFCVGAVIQTASFNYGGQKFRFQKAIFRRENFGLKVEITQCIYIHPWGEHLCIRLQDLFFGFVRGNNFSHTLLFGFLLFCGRFKEKRVIFAPEST